MIRLGKMDDCAKTVRLSVILHAYDEDRAPKQAQHEWRSYMNITQKCNTGPSVGYHGVGMGEKSGEGESVAFLYKL